MGVVKDVVYTITHDMSTSGGISEVTATVVLTDILYVNTDTASSSRERMSVVQSYGVVFTETGSSTASASTTLGNLVNR